MTGVEHYISIAGSAEVAGRPRRLVATVSNPTVELWSTPIVRGVAGEDSARRLTLPTARSAAPRFARDGTLLYLAARGGADAVWRLAGDRATELWKPPDGAIDGAVAVSPDGSQLCASVRRPERSTLYCLSATGANARPVGESLDVRGAPSWSPDGKWIAVAARNGAAVHVFKVPATGGEPVRLSAGEDYVPTRAAASVDEVYTAVSDTGKVSLCTRPLGPVVTEAQVVSVQLFQCNRE